MTLGIRKLIVVAGIGGIVLTANIVIVAAWLKNQSVVELAKEVRGEFLTGTALTIIVALLILLVGPKSYRAMTNGRRCPVCDHGVDGCDKYCGECGSKL